MLQLSSLYPIDLPVDDVTINNSTIVIRFISTKCLLYNRNGQRDMRTKSWTVSKIFIAFFLNLGYY